MRHVVGFIDSSAFIRIRLAMAKEVASEALDLPLTTQGERVSLTFSVDFRSTPERGGPERRSSTSLTFWLGFRSPAQRTFWRITAAVLTVSSLLLWTWPWISPRISTRFVARTDNDVPNIGFPESLLRSWAQYAPYIPVAKYAPPPPGCVVSQVSFNLSLLQTNT